MGLIQLLNKDNNLTGGDTGQGCSPQINAAAGVCTKRNKMDF